MGLFDKIFEKKNCDICGGEIGLLGNKKLDDGNLCKDCAKKLSPFFSERRQSTVEDIRQQLAYREENAEKLKSFNPTLTLGDNWKVYIDESQKAFVCSSMGNWLSTNPDIIPFSQVTGARADVSETRTEEKWRDDEGNMQSYNPPRWDVDYDIWISIDVNNPYFNNIRFKLNSFRLETNYDARFNNCMSQANQICDALTRAREETRAQVQAEAAAAVAAAAPKMARTCPFCGATTFPDANGRCEYCGGAMGA